MAVASLKKIVETKGASYRSFALRELLSVKPDERAYVAKFLNDDAIKTTANDLLKPKAGAPSSANAKAAPASPAASAKPALVAKAAPKKAAK